MSEYLLLKALIAVSALCAVQFAHAGCSQVNEGDARFHGNGMVVKFTPWSAGGGDAVGASLSRANEVAPYIRIRSGPDLAKLKNEPFDSNGGSVYYLEASGQGQRICRAEQWRRRESKLINEAPPQSLHPAVKPLYPYFELYKVNELDYDASGQLTSIRRIDRLGRKVTTFCALYDENGRVEVANESSGLIVSEDPDFQCSELRNTPVSEVTRYFSYRSDGFLALDMTKRATRKLGESAEQEDVDFGTEATDGAWYAQGDFFFNGANFHHRVGASFQMSDKRGLTGIQSESFAIASSDATPIFEQRSRDVGKELNYTFPGERVSPDVLKGQFDGVIAYARVREYFHRTGQRVFEIFAPGVKYPRERQWRTLDLNRQENYDANGKLTRVILSGPVSDDDGYTENLRAYAEKGILKLTPLTSGYSSYRVYDYDAAGKETLSFVCWRYEVSTNKPYAHFPWWEPDPRPKRSREAELQYARTQVGTRCGTPDGKMSVEGMGPVKTLMETKYGFGTTKLGLPGE
ncbi:TPA: hypothetical protein ACOEPF_003845 [Stenotrophomonas maltophilia]|uniref:hypothetical protein n=1 Tax=Stenotrophomonas TaxID=40323 RepID=UPI00201CE8BE|nr:MULTISPECIES: hypothetical protein [Stenotrophomonas]MBN5026724.1 hypothetical protein [Stenotrophomonas maltophilia]MDH1275638.1 hypothetical protein [Stenotrophomonas sp. GD03937]MDH1487266.1 hypothetical protein [Stenotrophomonas sp. GD03712]UQY97440.1 hypothetical protein LZ605_08810 [Stenotrophomonas maltophilia]WON70091.1 hypothetical protein RWT08_07070 [Stenotrophomonas maltophilia]